MIDSDSLISTEDLITLEQARHLPFLPHRNGKPPHFTTVWRWATVGFNGIKLETVNVGATICTSANALRRFFAALAAPPAPKPPTETQREAARRAAARKLDAAGIK